MPMKTSVVIADGTFATNTAPILGPTVQAMRRAAQIGYDAVSLTVNEPEKLDVPEVLAACRQNHFS